MKNRTVLLFSLAGFVLAPARPAYAQQEDHQGPCAHAEAGTFDFMVGRWHGEEKRVVDQDTTVVATADIVVEHILDGCALREHWDAYEQGKKMFSAELLRAYDGSSQRWMLSYVDDRLFQVWEGRKAANGPWQFYREWELEGAPILSRITWEPTSWGFQQRIEQSRDGGETFQQRSIITYRRAP